jgi:uroporphyrin-III C-methyltransferase
VSNFSKKIYLVGAGPGDIDLLTLGAINILKEADVILYDALVNENIFEFCKPDVIKEYVGKRKNNHLKNQDEINDTIIEYAKSHNIVVRLKGGTPFVFGRGFEEVRAIKKSGFEPVVISGVSSATAVAESFMIPLIDREYSDSFRTITGHDVGILDEVITHYHPRENLVILMGIHNLKEIVKLLLSKGFPSSTPTAILSRGTTQSANKYIATLHDISLESEEFFDSIRAKTPAIIYVGHTLEGTISL